MVPTDATCGVVSSEPSRSVVKTGLVSATRLMPVCMSFPISTEGLMSRPSFPHCHATNSATALSTAALISVELRELSFGT